jgi:hypothetical protein
MSIPSNLTQNIVLLADQASTRAHVVASLLEQIGDPPLRVIKCSYVAECLKQLDVTIIRPRLLVANNELTDGHLLPALQRWQYAQRRPLPQLIVWAPAGMLSVVDHKDFLDRHQAIVFSFPLDLDALLGVARSFALHSWLHNSHTRQLARCGWLCRRRRECIKAGCHCHAREVR